MLQTRHSFPLLFSALLLLSRDAFGAACCGGSFAAPSLIVGDDRAQVTASYAYSEVTDDVGADSFWRRRDTRESSETIKIEGAHIFQDRWQAGVSVPVIRRTRAGNSSSGLGDVAGTLGYEYLPDWDYNPWRPRGLGFLRLIAPTGRSINEADTTYQLDSRGRGFWAIGAGTILSKTLGSWDLFSSLDVHRSFKKNYSNPQSSGVLKPGFGGSFGFGAGYSLSAFRLGAGLTWIYEDPVNVSGTATSQGSLQRYATANLSASYLLPDEYAVTVSYADQTLFGSPVNTTLGKGVTVFFQKRWLR